MKDEIDEQAERLTNKLQYWASTLDIPMADIDSDAEKFLVYFENTDDQNLVEWTDFVESRVSEHVPGSVKLILAHLTLAAAFMRCFYKNRRSERPVWSLLIFAAEQLSQLEGLVFSTVTEREVRALKLSEGGKRGAQVKHRHTKKLKEWAVAQAKRLSGSDMEISRRLVFEIPAELKNASKSPERAIYDAIRADRKAGS